MLNSLSNEEMKQQLNKQVDISTANRIISRLLCAYRHNNPVCVFYFCFIVVDIVLYV
jgi:hypothetical protein